MLTKLPATVLTASLAPVLATCLATCLAASFASAQAQDLKAQQSQYKKKVDRSIMRLAEQKLETGLQAAKYLVALTHCHRKYTRQMVRSCGRPCS